MSKCRVRFLAGLLLLALLAALAACGAPQSQMEKTAGYLQAEAPEPSHGSLGGDWLVFGLARSGVDVSQSYYDGYYAQVEAWVREKQGVLHDRKYTEYSRLVLSLTAIGRDPADVAGYDLLLPLGDFQGVTQQGINGAIFALLALDCGGYEMPDNPDAEVQATREMYVQELLRREIPDGGWALTGDTPDVDITAMTLQALARYREQPAVAEAVERGLAVLSGLQEEDGGYASWGIANSESISQVIVALTELGISPEDSRFVKGNTTLEQALLRYGKDSGGFCHELDNGAREDLMATEQAFYALAALDRAGAGKTTLYDMTDVGA